MDQVQSAVANQNGLAEQRHKAILEALAQHGAIRVAAISQALGVAQMTIRRDLKFLERQGKLQRVYGGAVALVTADRNPHEVENAGELWVPTIGPDLPISAGEIGVLVPTLGFYWPRVVNALEGAAGQAGFTVAVRESTYEAKNEMPILKKLVRNDGVRGLLIAPNTLNGREQQLADWLAGCGVPVVLMERELPFAADGTPIEGVLTDHAQGALLAVRHLAELGHRRVGLVLTRLSPNSRKVAAGWRQGCTEMGLTNEESFARMMPDRAIDPFPRLVGEVVTQAMASDTTALLVHSDEEAAAVVQAAQARGLSVPGDLSVVSYDDEIADQYVPALTAVSPPRGEIGETAVYLFISRLLYPNRAVRRVLMSPKLVSRQTTAAPNRR